MSKEKFVETRNLFKRMSDEIIIVVGSYYIWRTLFSALSIPEVGKDVAEKNARLMNLYKDFFVSTERAHLQNFVLGVMKFFDKNPLALSFKGLIGQIQFNKENLTIQDLKEAHPHLEQIGAVPVNYSPVKEETTDIVDGIIKKHEGLLLKLKDIRDKELAHTDIEPHKGDFIPNEVEILIHDIQETFNKISNDFDLSVTTFNFIKQDAINSTRFLFDNLERGEAKRQKEIEEKYGYIR